MHSLVCRCGLGTRLALAVRAISSKPNNGQESPLRQLLDNSSTYSEAGAAVPAEGELEWATQPYAAGVREDPRHQTDPRETTVLLFPGQGSQYVGMGRQLQSVPAARDLYELASEVVGWDVGRVCHTGPADELERRCQTAVLVTALGALELAREKRPGAVEQARAAAGFSLGEITALVWGGALPLEGALRLVELRAAAMEAAARARPGGMLTTWLAPDARLGPLMRDAAASAAPAVPNAVCQVANYLYSGCKVLAGDEEALRFVERSGRAYGVRRCARVRVSGAFHTALMARAENAVREALTLLDVRAPRGRVLSCVDARPYSSVGDVRRRLARLTTAPVRWEQTLHTLYARPRDAAQPLTLALGPGAALRATLKMVNARAWDTSLQIEV